eukprot:2996636-Amphidinium_carterae.1
MRVLKSFNLSLRCSATSVCTTPHVVPRQLSKASSSGVQLAMRSQVFSCSADDKAVAKIQSKPRAARSELESDEEGAGVSGETARAEAAELLVLVGRPRPSQRVPGCLPQTEIAVNVLAVAYLYERSIPRGSWELKFKPVE